jgi:hypothetical protein
MRNSFRPHFYYRILLYLIGLLIVFDLFYTLSKYLKANTPDNGLTEDVVLVVIAAIIVIYFVIDAYYTRYIIEDKSIIVRKFLRKEKVLRGYLYMEEKIIAGPLKYFEIYFDKSFSLKIPNIDNEAAFVACLGIDHVKRTRLW